MLTLLESKQACNSLVTTECDRRMSSILSSGTLVQALSRHVVKRPTRWPFCKEAQRFSHRKSS